jgi:hypothetical protein
MLLLHTFLLGILIFKGLTARRDRTFCLKMLNRRGYDSINCHWGAFAGLFVKYGTISLQ